MNAYQEDRVLIKKVFFVSGVSADPLQPTTNTPHMKNVAVILAGGGGVRFHPNAPKQFAKVAGKTVLEHTLDVFQQNEKIDEICIIIKSDFKWKVEDIIYSGSYSKVKKILSGGEERKDSSLIAIRAYDDSEDIVLIFHDAVRPFVSDEIINSCVDYIKYYDAIDVAIPAVDTIIEVEDCKIKNIPKRSRMMQGQTPQAFKLRTIKKAYKLAESDESFTATDDCGVVKKYLPDTTIYVVNGSIENIKITYQQDIFTADKLFQIRMQQLDFIHSDEFYGKHLLNRVMVVFGGSYGIGKEIADLANRFSCKAYCFSRSTTNTDVSQAANVRRDLSFVMDKEGKIDYVVNTAAILTKGPLLNTSFESILNTTNVNYLGAVIVAKESFPYLEKTHGQLLNFTSSSYTRGRENYSLYSSTKAAIVNLVQALSSEWKVKGVRINCINPERTNTPMRIQNFGHEDPKTLLSATKVAYSSINTLLAKFTGLIVDVRHKTEEGQS